ncbi:MAG TPA: cation:proton antiporter [Thermodesulfovibrionia bacterium]|nr:cation:proton antiporter [Thermodesulfovibrionia bacterium]
MSVTDVLHYFVIIFGLSAAVIFLLHRFKIPSIAGFLIAGVILGPHGFGLVEDVHGVELLAEIGVILLLFTIGLEFSISDFIKAKGTIAAGALQVLLTIFVTALVAVLCGYSGNTSIFIGFLVSLSSTAIVLKILSDKAEVDSFHGRAMVGILIFQDICLIPLMFLIPVLSGGRIVVSELLLSFLKAFLVILIVFLGGRWVVPRLLFFAVRTKSRELFIIAIVLVCLGVAVVTSHFGLSLAIGAFLAGLILSESEYGHQAMSEILPMKEIFIGLFFVSVGMLLNLKYTSLHFSHTLQAFGIILGIKTVITSLVVLLMKYPLKQAIHVGLGLAQIGEFSFVMAGVGKANGLISMDGYQLFLSASVLSMLSAPFLLMIAPKVAEWVSELIAKGKAVKLQELINEESQNKMQAHVIIIGFGLTGRTLSKVLKEADIPYVILDLNINTVKAMKKQGEPVHFGDATSPEILNSLGIKSARILVIAINIPGSVRRIVDTARRQNPNIYIVVRTRYVIEVDELRATGANEVIPEEFEVSIEIFARVLHHYHVPYNTIADFVDSIRKDNYQSLRAVDLGGKHLFASCETFPCQIIPDIQLESYLLSGKSRLSCMSLKETDLRAKTGVTLIAVRRQEQLFSNPGADFKLQQGDVLFLTGDTVTIKKAIQYFEGSAL